MRTTIRDVSERAGVSVATVSNVLNAPQLVAEQTRQWVRATIEELGYRPSRAARSLRAQQRSYLIGYPLPNRGVSPLLEVFLHELVSTSAEYGLGVVLFTARPGQSDVDAFRDVIRRGDVDGFVVAETDYDDSRIELFGAAGFPFAAFGRSRAPVLLSWVDVDGGAGIAAAARHLHTRGHRRIALVAWPEGAESGDDRVEGYRRALGELGLPIEEELLVRVGDGSGARPGGMADPSPARRPSHRCGVRSGRPRLRGGSRGAGIRAQGR